MGSPRSKRRAAAGSLLALALGTACHLAPAKVWNLEQLHAPDGAPQRRGRLKNDLVYLLGNAFQSSNFGGDDFQTEAQADKRIEDPLGECLENLVELGECERDEKVAGLQAAAFGWLAADCTNLLSRERSVLELGALAQALELAQAPAPPAGEPATPEEVKAAFDDLLAVVRDVLAAPALAGATLEASCNRIRALALDRPGALRLLRATNELLQGGERGGVLAPLRALRLELARRVVTLALRAALEDPHGRVRAAALDASLRAFPEERAQLLRWALVDPMPELEGREDLSLRALQLLARYGMPPRPADEDPRIFARFWEDLLVQVLRLQVDGPHEVAACKALAKITGEPMTLRPEIWLARARAAGPAPQPESAVEPGTEPGTQPGTESATEAAETP